MTLRAFTFCLFLMLFNCTARVLACSCAPPPPPAKALEASAAVFTGTVMSVEQDKHTLTVTLALTRSWKGPRTETLKLTTGENSAMCGYGFVKGETYLVYAYKSADGFGTNICTRTTHIDQADKDLNALGEGTPVKSSE